MAQIVDMQERRERFRTFIAGLDGARDPQQALNRGLYVARNREIAQQVVARLELRPSATQLIVGGIGTGKTTQLLVARERLGKSYPRAVSVYVDVSAYQDLARLKPGSLVAIVGLALLEHEDVDDTKATRLRKVFDNWAYGFWLSPDEVYLKQQYDEEEEQREFIPGVVTPPDTGLDGGLKWRFDKLNKFVADMFEGREIVVFIDSLDRVTDLSAFETVVEQDIAALSSMGIGLVIVGPLRALYGLQRTILDRFDHFYRQSVVDVGAEAGQAFLDGVLRKRDTQRLLPESQRTELVRLSGGVLRDLIRLTHQAGEEAYLGGADVIEDSHVRHAADAFGRSLMMGLSSEDIDKLRVIHESNRFVETSERDLALLVTRRVLDYQDGADVRYRVHPTIAPLLVQAAQ